jgi:hypothetical protein
MPSTVSGWMRASLTTARTTVQTARQMSSDDCSAYSGSGRWIWMGSVASASRLPVKSNSPARALAVPTSTPIT